jgi:RimJ/RimL family protein N-acetyltransferase
MAENEKNRAIRLAPDYPLMTERLLLRPITIDDAAAMYAYKSDPDAVRYVPYGPLGDVVLFWRSELDRSGEVGYIFDPAAAGHGFATEAVGALLALGFDGLGLHRIATRIDERNTASVRVVERLGLRHEARLVESEWFKDGWATMLIHALLASEWRDGAAAEG